MDCGAPPLVDPPRPYILLLTTTPRSPKRPSTCPSRWLSSSPLRDTLRASLSRFCKASQTTATRPAGTCARAAARATCLWSLTLIPLAPRSIDMPIARECIPLLVGTVMERSCSCKTETPRSPSARSEWAAHPAGQVGRIRFGRWTAHQIAVNLLQLHFIHILKFLAVLDGGRVVRTVAEDGRLRKFVGASRLDALLR